MSQFHQRVVHAARCFRMPFVFLCLALAAMPLWSQSPADRQIIISSEVSGSATLYKINGKVVEDKPGNSLIKNLTDIVRTRGSSSPIVVIIDRRASFAEVGKLETALDKVGITGETKIYIANFQTKTMNEIHWESGSKPLP